MNNKDQITELREKCIGLKPSTPLERCWALRNYVGKMTGRFDVADEISAMICDLLMQYQPHDKMGNKTDDDCSEYWQQTKDYLLEGR